MGFTDSLSGFGLCQLEVPLLCLQCLLMLSTEFVLWGLVWAQGWCPWHGCAEDSAYRGLSGGVVCCLMLSCLCLESGQRSQLADFLG